MGDQTDWFMVWLGVCFIAGFALLVYAAIRFLDALGDCRAGKPCPAWARWYTPRWDEFKRVVVKVSSIAIACILPVGLYFWADDAGRIPHETTSSVTFPGSSWIEGEIKECQTVRGNGAELTSVLECGDGPSRRFDVTFWGRTKQAEYALVTWDCRKTGSGIVCEERRGVK